MKNDSVCLSASVVDAVEMCCLVAYECCCSITSSTAREGCRPLAKSRIFFKCFVPVSSDHHYLSQWPPTQTDTYLRSLLHLLPRSTCDSLFTLNPSKLSELSASQSLKCRKAAICSTFPCCFINTTEYTVKVFCDGTFLLFYDSCELNLIFFLLYHLPASKCHERWSHQSTYMFSSPIMQNAERILTVSVIMLVCLGSIARASNSRLRSSPKILCSPYCERDNNWGICIHWEP